MYTGFNLENISVPEIHLTKEWDVLFSEYKRKMHSTLHEYTTQNGMIDGKKIQDDWFPEVKANIFISHSHADEPKAINLARWLYDRFDLVAFVDSCVWGYADELLKEIDDRYCWNSDRNSYIYERRNYSTSHVHMMLMTALNKMIDKTECVFFLNTKNSISLANIESETLSPWIYGEIEITRTIRKQTPEREETRTYSKGGMFEKLGDSILEIKYPVDISHFNSINMDILKAWDNRCQSKGADALDELYKITGLIPHRL